MKCPVFPLSHSRCERLAGCAGIPTAGSGPGCSGKAGTRSAGSGLQSAPCCRCRPHGRGESSRSGPGLLARHRELAVVEANPLGDEETIGRLPRGDLPGA